MRSHQILALVMAGATVFASGLALAQARSTPAEQVLYRQEQMRRVGATFKGITDGMRRSEPDLNALRGQARTLAQLSQEAPGWFPAGTALPVGEKNRARAAIWSDAARFAQEMSRFQTATANLASATDLESFRSQVRAVAPSCARCHDAFTEPD